MDVLGDLVARDRRSERPAFYAAETNRSVSYHDFCTTAYKAGNVLRYLGVREGATVAVGGGVGRHPLWAFYGAGQLGATTRFVDGEAAATGDPRVLLLPVADEETVSPGPSTKLATYGGAPAQATTLHWEKELWSENPAVHPTDVDPADPLLAGGEETYTHADLLDAARAVVDAFDLGEASRIAVRGPLVQPHVVAAGLVAPILAGGTVVVPDEGASADVAVVGDDDENPPEPRACRAADVPL
ncbi:acetyl-CoA synthetase [Salinigranum rubrum]|uniref:Acetyl-CoA synthetase n=1 Tax=Salinigranum rubrum TaxID=755307 RepID=A0A2I8VPZ1_9EURY|nr:acetyl-CoA synthetase [Salinigranum rubrum]AUV83944.1 acetyl-CoA synthetase [Salinigranum rubrum]